MTERILVYDITIMFKGYYYYYYYYYYYEHHISESLQAVSCVIKRKWLSVSRMTLFGNVRHCSVVDSYGRFGVIFGICFEDGEATYCQINSSLLI